MDVSLYCKSPAFHYMLHATGQSEVWSNARPEDKFCQYGWRCGKNENAYSPGTMIGNWFEERSDIIYSRARRPVRSQFPQYFETTYAVSWNREEKRPTYSLKKQQRSFPGHQPELDLSPSTTPPISCYRLAYKQQSRSMPTAKAITSQTQDGVNGLEQS